MSEIQKPVAAAISVRLQILIINRFIMWIFQNGLQPKLLVYNQADGIF